MPLAYTHLHQIKSTDFGTHSFSTQPSNQASLQFQNDRNVVSVHFAPIENKLLKSMTEMGSNFNQAFHKDASYFFGNFLQGFKISWKLVCCCYTLAQDKLWKIPWNHEMSRKFASLISLMSVYCLRSIILCTAVKLCWSQWQGSTKDVGFWCEKTTSCDWLIASRDLESCLISTIHMAVEFLSWCQSPLSLINSVHTILMLT